jgi:putative addiction module component (TIGR02574 family)
MAVEKVLQEALALPSEDRARLLEALQESLEPDEEWGKAWAAEVARRVKDLDEGRTRAIPAEEVFAKLRARFPPR